MNARQIAKRVVQAAFLLFALIPALLSAFGRIKILFELFAQLFAALPGFYGSFARAAYYRLTLADCSQDVAIGLGTYFSRAGAIVAENVSIGSYCVVGNVKIGARTQISSHVDIPGGRAQHRRDANGRLSDTIESESEQLEIGEDCWIGAAAVVMAKVGAQSTIGAGSVVVKEIPAGVVAVGAPARVIRSSIGGAAE